MVRALVYVVLVFAVAAGFVWLADHPGQVTLVWQGYQIRVSLMVFAVAIVVIMVLIGLGYVLLRGLIRSPRRLGRYMGARRRDRGYTALSRGMVAIGAGDQHAALRFARESRQFLRDEPMTLLLAAQAAQLAGDADAAVGAFREMLQRPDTAILGLRGLFIEAKRRGDRDAAKGFALQATRMQNGVAWAGLALFEYQAADAEWAGALETLAANTSARIVEKSTARRLQAVLTTARALEMEAGEPEQARAGALEAHRLAPELVPAAVLAGRLSARFGDLRRAAKVLETTWKAEPHPDIAAAYGALRPGDSVRDRLKRIRSLAQLRANHPEGQFALARAAIDARAWQDARDALQGLVAVHPTERACLMMAEIEDGEHNDAGRTRDWLTRALRAAPDPAWVADGFAFDAWAAVSPISGRVDAFEWRAPPERLAHVSTLLDAGPPSSSTTLATGADFRPIGRTSEPPGAGTELVALSTPQSAPPVVSPPSAADRGAEILFNREAVEEATVVTATPSASAPKPTAAATNGAAHTPSQPEAKVAGEAPAFVPPRPDDPGPEPEDARAPARRLAIFS